MIIIRVLDGNKKTAQNIVVDGRSLEVWTNGDWRGADQMNGVRQKNYITSANKNKAIWREKSVVDVLLAAGRGVNGTNGVEWVEWAQKLAFSSLITVP